MIHLLPIFAVCIIGIRLQQLQILYIFPFRYFLNANALQTPLLTCWHNLLPNNRTWLAIQRIKQLERRQRIKQLALQPGPNRSIISETNTSKYCKQPIFVYYTISCGYSKPPTSPATNNIP